MKVTAEIEKSGKYVSDLRASLGLTQKELSEKLNVTQGYISRVEKGHKNVSFSLLIEWCQVLGLKEIKINLTKNNITYR